MKSHDIFKDRDVKLILKDKIIMIMTSYETPRRYDVKLVPQEG